MIANRVLRRRRLWALFLAEHLSLSPAEADTIACEFEHVTPLEVEIRLDQFLGGPTVDPEGKLIPSAEARLVVGHELSVNDLDVGGRARITRIAGDRAARSFFRDQGLVEDLEVEVMAVGSDGGRLLKTENGSVHLTSATAAEVLIRPIN
jgi:DtxR family Mn-dependent transcriptional regulator